MGEQLLRDAAAVLQPGSSTDDSGRVPDWVRRALTRTSRRVAYYGRNIAATPERTGELSAALRAENPHVLVAVDAGRGRRHPARRRHRVGVPGQLRPGLRGRPGTDRDGRAADRALAVAGGDQPELRAGRGSEHEPGQSRDRHPVLRVRRGLAARHSAAYVRGCRRPAWRGVRSTFPATATPPWTRTTGCRWCSTPTRSGETPGARSGPRSGPGEVGDDRAHPGAAVRRGVPVDHEPQGPGGPAARRARLHRLGGHDGIEMAAIADTFGSPRGRSWLWRRESTRLRRRRSARRVRLPDAARRARGRGADGGSVPSGCHDAATRVRELGAWAAAQRTTVEGRTLPTVPRPDPRVPSRRTCSGFCSGFGADGVGAPGLLRGIG